MASMEWNRRNKEYSKKYNRARYLRDRENIKLRSREWRKNNLEKAQAYYLKVKDAKNKRRKELRASEPYRSIVAEKARAYRRTLRSATIQAYGGECACCGESTPEFLAIDHIKGRKGEDGKKDKRLGVGIYQWLRARGFPKDNYRLLCSNCNNARSWFGECPHERDRRNAANAA